MAILKIKDQEGNIIDIPAIRGDKGTDGYTPQKGVDYFTPEDIAELNIPSVDQTYTPTSKNAQSGKAVAEAVTAEQQRADNTFANALKCSKSGSAILIDDISPVTHEIGVKVKNKNLFNETAIVNTTIIGLTMSTNSDGSHKLSGTLSGQKFSYFNKVNLSQIIPKGTAVTVSGWYDVTPTGNYIGLVGYAKDNKILFQVNENAGGEHLTTTLTDDLVSVGIVVRCAASAIGDTITFDNIRLQLELGLTATAYTPYVPDLTAVKVIKSNASGEAVAEYTPNADGTVESVTSLYPNTTLITDTDGVIINCEYNRDINKAFAALEAAIATNNS